MIEKRLIKNLTPEQLKLAQELNEKQERVVKEIETILKREGLQLVAEHVIRLRPIRPKI